MIISHESAVRYQAINLIRVDFPHPLGQTKAVFCQPVMFRLKFLKIMFLLYP